MNGALAQADVLGIFGREGLDLATMWGEPKPTDPGAYAFRMYRDYDGAGSRFGDVSVSAASGDQGQLAVYGAQRSTDQALTLMVVNKTADDLTAPLSVAGFTGNGTAQRYTYSGADLASIVHGDDLAVSGSQVTATYPANSITLLVLPHGDGGPTITPPPPTPPTPTPPATTPPATTPPSTSPPTSPPPTGGTGCSATLHVDNDWGSGFTATVTVANSGSSTTTGWRVSWAWPGSQRITNAWNTTLAQSGATVAADNVGWNGSIPARGSTSFGFQATSGGATPALSCTTA